MALRYLGLARDRSGRSEAAVEPLRDALRIYGERLPAGHEKIVATGIDLGRCLLNANRGDEAEAPLRAAEEAGAAPDSALERELWTELVRLCDHRGLAEEASRYRERLAQAN